jgi:hypothetical protein
MPPLTSAYPIAVVRPSAPAGIHVQKLDFREGALNGFAACQNRKDIIYTARDDVAAGRKAKRHVFIVDDQVVRDLESDRGSTTSIVAGDVLSLAPRFVFERDEYVFITFKADL